MTSGWWPGAAIQSLLLFVTGGSVSVEGCSDKRWRGGFFAGDGGVSAAPCARGLDLTCWVMGYSEAPATYNLENVGVGGV